MNYVNQLTTQSKKYISTFFIRVVNPLSEEPNNDFISKNINVHEIFEVLITPIMNMGVLVSFLVFFQVVIIKITLW